jgi:predicted nuclease of predicted toxin-antitoxin system
MRVLLDESLPRQLKNELPGHQVKSVGELGWAGTKNGELLRLADERFEVFVTPDVHLPEQQNLRGLRLSIIILRARSTDLEDLLPLVPSLLEFLARIPPGQVVRLGG